MRLKKFIIKFDGNKRTGYALLELLLLEAGITVQASEDEKYDMVIAASTGEFRFDDIKQWLIANTK